MAGRGTDIKLGEGVADLGGLAIIGTERHESRRIDNQLRGRAGRQGDNGSSKFYVSLEDSLMRIFGSERISKVMLTLGMKEGEAIEHKFISRAIENAQRKVEGHNFEIRQQVLKYDDVMNKQRDVIYSLRRSVLEEPSLVPMITDMMSELALELVEQYTFGTDRQSEWDIEGLKNAVANHFRFVPNFEMEKSTKKTDLEQVVRKKALELYELKRKDMSDEIMLYFERMFLLNEIDVRWKEHLQNMDHLREGIGLRGYAQKEPLLEYKREGFELFMMTDQMIRENTIKKLMTVQLVSEEQLANMEMKKESKNLSYLKPQANTGGTVQQQTVKREGTKIGRNDPCLCGSGKKYKKCCLKE